MATKDRKATDPAAGAAGSTGVKLLLLGGLLVVGLVVGLVMENLFRGRQVSAGGAAATAGAAAKAPERFYPTPGSQGKAPEAEPEKPTIQPWESTPENTPSVPPGHVPAWQIKPPRPDPTPPPPPPAPPPDPATHRPPMHNPGGVDGDRPPRPVPGLQ